MARPPRAAHGELRSGPVERPALRCAPVSAPLCPRDGTPLQPAVDLLGPGTKAHSCPKCTGVLVPWDSAQAFFTSLGLSLENLQSLVRQSDGRARKTDAGGRILRAVVRLSGSESESGDIAPATAYDFYQSVFEAKPGGGAWTPTDVDAMEVGYKVQA